MIKKIQLIFCALLLALSNNAQDFLGLQSSNFSGIHSVYSNPANIADNRMKFDMSLLDFSFTLDNNFVYAKPASLKYKGSIFKPSDIQFPSTWTNTDKNSADYWKNNFVINENAKNRNVYSNQRLTVKSFLFTINRKNSLAFTWNIRNYINIDGISNDLAHFAFSEFKDPNYLGKDMVLKKFSLNQMAWAEYALAYGRVLKEDGEHFFKAGASIKLLQGLEGVYMRMEDVRFNLDTPRTINVYNSNIAYGHSQNFDSYLFNKDGFNNALVKNYNFNNANPSLGLDLGLIYEWRPEYEKYKYDMDGEKGLWRRDKNKYTLKFGFAVNDIGGIRFKKSSISNDFTANFKDHDLNSFSNVKTINEFDSVITKNFGSKSIENTFKMALPTSINLFADYHIWNDFYVNLMANICNLQPNKTARVHDYTNISLSPRYDHKWFGVTVPVSYNVQTASRGKPIILGTALRAGPIALGTNNLLDFFNRDFYGANLYFVIKIPVPYGKPKDKDKDGISDKRDHCKTVPGVWEFMGCPDKDGDHIPDAEDKCPDVAGVKELMGCPDKDSDGVTDSADVCPDEKGLVEFNGCPDKDGDKITDKEDECPDEAGLKEFMGCPDKDGDHVPDKFDKCPDVFGLQETNGCPDTDKDGVLDKEDKCIELAGPQENNGCPWPDTDNDKVLDKDDDCPRVPGLVELKGCPPPVVKPSEQKIIEKAFSSLEFATGKDIIKSSSFASLKELAGLLKLHSTDWTLKLSGHTDSDGEAEANMLLSEKRVNAVKRFLVKNGVKADKVLTEWFGEEQPIDTNTTAKGKQRNRRVEMKVLLKE